MDNRDDEDPLTALRMQVVKTSAFVKGTIAIGTIAFAAIQYFALRELQGIDEMTNRITETERQITVLELKVQYLVNKEKVREGMADQDDASSTHHTNEGEEK